MATRRPNRSVPRFLDAKRVADIVCWFLENRGEEDALRLELSKCLDCGSDEKCKREKQAIAEAVSNAVRQENTLTLADAVLAAFEISFRTVERVARFVPQVRPLVVPLRVIVGRIGVVRAEVRAARAANDATLRVLRLAA